MSKIIVIYQSKYGSSKRYAEWLSEELSCDLIKRKDAVIEEIMKYETIIFGGGIYAGRMLGISFLKDNYLKLRDKNIVVFGVGASPYDEKVVSYLRDNNLKGSLSEIPCFYCRGTWDEEKMSFRDKILCSMLKKVVSKKDPENYEPWEKALAEAMNTSKCDWTRKDNIKPIVEFIQEL